MRLGKEDGGVAVPSRRVLREMERYEALPSGRCSISRGREGDNIAPLSWFGVSGLNDRLSLLRSRGMALRLNALDATEPSENVLDVSLIVLSLAEIALTRLVLPRLKRLDIADETEDLERTEGVLPAFTWNCAGT